MEITDIRPTRGRLLCEILSGSEISSGGIILPGFNKGKIAKGRVISVGNPIINTCKTCEDKSICKFHSCPKKNKEFKAPAKAGDVIFHKPVLRGKIKVDSKKCVIVNFLDVIGVEGGE